MFEVIEIDSGRMDEYRSIPMSHEVKSIFRVDSLSEYPSGLRLVEQPVDAPWVKTAAEETDGIDTAPARFDVSNWAFFLARDGGRPVGGAVVASDTDGVWMLDGRNDLAVLWDIRVRSDRKRTGVGSALFKRSVEWSRGRGLKQLKIETQNTNVPACHFYESMGCELRGIVGHAYAVTPEFADEVMLLWWLDL